MAYQGVWIEPDGLQLHLSNGSTLGYIEDKLKLVV
jgi:hypothetical protein